MDERDRGSEIIRQEDYRYGGPGDGYSGLPRGGRSSFSNAAVLLAFIGLGTLFVPWLTLVLGVMAILFGALALRRQEPGRGRAITGIAVGGCMVLLGGTLIICMSALMPYQDDLIRIFNDYMMSHGMMGY